MKRILLALLLAAPLCAAFLISNSAVGNGFVFQSVPSSLRPVAFLVDTEAVPGVSDPRSVAQQLMDAWNAAPGAADLFGVATSGGPYNGSTAGITFGKFEDGSREIAFDADGTILNHYGLSAGVLGITLKSVDVATGRILDVLVVVNTQPGALSAPGTGASTEQLFRATLLHELGHVAGLGHTPTGLANTTTFGFDLLTPAEMPTMWAFRLPNQPQEGATLEADDIAGITRIYPTSLAGLGSISGRVRGVSGAAVNEIAVRAIGPSGAAEEHVGVLSNADGTEQGRYTIPNLKPGGYRVLVEAVNGRGNVDEIALAGGSPGLGNSLFLLAADEYYEPGDTYDPAVDDPADAETVEVRAGRDTGSIDFVLNARPILQGQSINAAFAAGDAQYPDTNGGFHFVDYYVFQGAAGQEVTLTATGGLATPQLQLCRPSDYSTLAEHLPAAGSASIATTLDQSGIHTVAVIARATTGNPGGTGVYTLTLTGAGGALPAAPTLAGATLGLSPADPGSRGFASPVCRMGVLSLRAAAPSHEELWIDSLRLRASGSGDDFADVTEVRLVRDANGDGVWQGGEPLLGTGHYSADDGTVQFTEVALELDPGTVADLLVVYDVSFPATAGPSGAPGLPLALLPALAGALAALLGRRRLRNGSAALLLALLPLSCGGGGDDGGCNGAFDAAKTVTGYACRVDPGDLVAFTPTGNPGTPLLLPAGSLLSGTLSVSR